MTDLMMNKTSIIKIKYDDSLPGNNSQSCALRCKQHETHRQCLAQTIEDVRSNKKVYNTDCCQSPTEDIYKQKYNYNIDLINPKVQKTTCYCINPNIDYIKTNTKGTFEECDLQANHNASTNTMLHNYQRGRYDLITESYGYQNTGKRYSWNFSENQKPNLYSVQNNTRILPIPTKPADKAANQKPPSSISSSSGCIGSSTLFRTNRGIIQLSEMIPGDVIGGQIVYCVYEDGPQCEHLLFYLNSGDIVALTEEHLLININGQLQCANTFIVGNKLFDNTIITKITKIIDYPMVPIVLSGKLTLPNSNNVVISCWSHNEEIAKNMDYLMRIVTKYITVLSPDKISSAMTSFYKEFRKNGKNMKNIDYIIKNLENKYLDDNMKNNLIKIY